MLLPEYDFSFRLDGDPMTTMSLELPNSLHEKIRQLAKEEGISINQFIVSAAAEKMASLLTEEYLQARTKRGDVDRFQSVLDKVPDVAPEEYDRIEP
jgi:uncharacterized protein (DUF1778 family)